MMRETTKRIAMVVVVVVGLAALYALSAAANMHAWLHGMTSIFD